MAAYLYLTHIQGLLCAASSGRGGCHPQAGSTATDGSAPPEAGEAAPPLHLMLSVERTLEAVGLLGAADRPCGAYR